MSIKGIVEQARVIKILGRHATAVRTEITQQKIAQT